MRDKICINNQAIVAGKIVSEFEFSHEIFGERFYFVKLKVSRLSHSNDMLPLLVSDRLINVNESHVGEYIEAKGQYRSYNRYHKRKRKLILTLFVRELELLGTLGNCEQNMIFLDGYICRQPFYRLTPRGREITDLMLAVNRDYSKTDYIPCICWGRNARYVKKLPVGSRIQVWGRMQSREYYKRTEDNNVVSHMAYEVSISVLELCQDSVVAANKVADSRSIG